MISVPHLLVRLRLFGFGLLIEAPAILKPPRSRRSAKNGPARSTSLVLRGMARKVKLMSSSLATALLSTTFSMATEISLRVSMLVHNQRGCSRAKQVSEFLNHAFYPTRKLTPNSPLSLRIRKYGETSSTAKALVECSS